MKNVQYGFTLVEITLVMVLIAILITITTPLVVDVVTKADLSSAHESLYNSLLSAQKLSQSQSRGEKWRLCIDNTAKTYTITAGTCISPLYPEIITIPDHITISSPQTLDIAFDSITGALNLANPWNLVTITLTSGTSSKSIILNGAGVIDKAP